MEFCLNVPCVNGTYVLLAEMQPPQLVNWSLALNVLILFGKLDLLTLFIEKHIILTSLELLKVY